MGIEKIGVLGSGQMGGGIAQVSALAGYDVILADQTREFSEKGKDRVEKFLSRSVEKNKIQKVDADAALSRIKCVGSFEELSDTDLVIEAVSENVDLKLKIFGDLDRVCKKSAILASNTSSISITHSCMHH